MKCRVLKSAFSIILAFSMIFLPVSAANVKADTKTLNIKALSTSDTTQTVTNYEELGLLAKEKASLLTSVYGATSVQYALIDNGKIVLSDYSGVYSKDSATPLSTTKMYGIGSISKLFTTVAVLTLVDEGKVNLDDPLVYYLPEFSMADTRYRNITVRMLLNHSSGLMGSTMSNSMLLNDTDSSAYDNFLSILKEERLKANPGEYSVYCNDGFTLAEKLVEKVSGKTFSDYVSTTISTPLNLYNTKTPADSFQRESIAKAYLPGISYTLPTESVSMIGAGGFYSSAENLCNFATIFMNDSSTLLSKKSRTAMEIPEYQKGLWAKEGDSTIAYGLGWDSVNTYPFSNYGITALSKGGDTLLYHSSLIVLPEAGMAMAILSSGGSSTYDQIMAQEILLLALKSKGLISEINGDKSFTLGKTVSVSETEKEFAGTYANYGGVYKADISNDGILSLSSVLLPEYGSEQFFHNKDGKYYSSDGSSYISFVNEKNGNTYLYVAGYASLPGLGQTAVSGYQMQKITDNPISEDLKKIWEKRNGKNYFLINEKYTSEYYAAGTLSAQLVLLTAVEGYALNAQIVDENTAKTNIQIPGVYGRDLSDYTFYTKNNTEYLKASGGILISEDGIKKLSEKSSFTCELNEDGYAKWYKISEASSNHMIKVTLPKDSAFAVYDSLGTCINYSYISGKDTVTLPENGYIVFAGDKNAVFSIQYLN